MILVNIVPLSHTNRNYLFLFVIVNFDFEAFNIVCFCIALNTSSQNIVWYCLLTLSSGTAHVCVGDIDLALETWEDIIYDIKKCKQLDINEKKEEIVRVLEAKHKCFVATYTDIK